MTPGVSIVIPSWNGLELLKRFLQSVIAAAIHYSEKFNVPAEIVIIDDGSIDATFEWLVGQGFADETEGGKGEWEKGRRGDGEMPTLRLMRNETNRGFGPTCNRGFNAAYYPLVFLLNNDVDVDVNSIAPLVENFVDDSVFAAHCRVFDLEGGHECGTGKVGGFSRGFIRVHRSYVCAPENTGEKARAVGGCTQSYSIFASGGSAMFDRDKFLEMGGFDSLLAPIYWEDVDISYRAWKRGFSVLYEPRSVVRHRVSSTMRKVSRQKVRQMKQRHRLIYHWVNLHDGRLMASHVFWVSLLAITAPLRFQPGFLASLFAALRKLPQIRKRRIEENRAARRTDREVFNIFASLETRPDVFAYDTFEELEAARPFQPR